MAQVRLPYGPRSWGRSLVAAMARMQHRTKPSAASHFLSHDDGRRRFLADGCQIVAGRTPLNAAEREILELAVAAGGRHSISGLSAEEMLQKAGTVVELKRRGLVWSWIKFSKTVPGLPEVIPVEVTPEGFLASGS